MCPERLTDRNWLAEEARKNRRKTFFFVALGLGAAAAALAIALS